ncbi:MAG TPA: 3'-5' exonuclease [Myxococcota bacterium]|nr:3'-5' exonuclease [Myxococcota bacterium]
MPGLKHPMLRIEPVSDELYAVSDLLLTELSRKRIWLFDLEATGLDTQKERVTQIAGCMFENGQIREETAFASFVWPGEGIEIPKVVRELTGITPEKLQGAPAFPEAWRSHLAAARGADFWMGQSVFEFDVPLLDAELARHRMPAELPATLDSVVLATWLLGPPAEGERWSTSRLLARFEVDTVGLRRHDALDDVKILGRLLQPMVRLVTVERADRMEIPAAQPLPIKRHPPIQS